MSLPAASFSVRCSFNTASLLVFAQPWKSETDPGSVASTSRTSPACITSISFFARTIGTGHFNPFTSSCRLAIGDSPSSGSGDCVRGAGGALVLAELPFRCLLGVDGGQPQVDADHLVVRGGRRLHRPLHGGDERLLVASL